MARIGPSVVTCPKLVGSSTQPRRSAPRTTAASSLGSGVATISVSVLLPMSGNMEVATHTFPRWSSTRMLRRAEKDVSTPMKYSVLPSAKSIGAASKSGSNDFFSIDGPLEEDAWRPRSYRLRMTSLRFRAHCRRETDRLRCGVEVSSAFPGGPKSSASAASRRRPAHEPGHSLTGHVPGTVGNYGADHPTAGPRKKLSEPLPRVSPGASSAGASTPGRRSATDPAPGRPC